MKLLFGADLHTTPKTPECRTDDFVSAQRTKLEWIMEQKKKYNAPFITAGDIIDTNSLTANEVYTMLDLWEGIHMEGILGNHDLPYHKIEFAETKMIGQILRKNYKWYEPNTVQTFPDCYIYPFNFGVEIDDSVIKYPDDFNIAIYHGMVTESKDKYLGGNTALELLKKNPGFDLIITGDNHIPFETSYKGRLLINPGCLTRDTISLVNYKPSIVLYDTETREWERLYVPIKDGVFNLETTSRVNKKKKVDMDEFVASLKNTKDVSNVFIGKLKSWLTGEDITDNIQTIVYDCTGGKV